jgi:IS30 family transposase
MDKIKEKQALLEKIYHDPSSSGGFAGVQRLYIEAKKQNSLITKSDAKHFLEGDRTYTLHRPRRIKFKRAKTIPSGLFTDIQMDLAQMDKFSRHNKGIKYILVVVDVLSKKLWAMPVKSKKYEDMSFAITNVLEQIPITPSRIFTDNGKEFFLNKKIMQKGKTIKTINFYQDRGIEKYWSSTKTIKAALAERYIRILKSRIYRYFSEKNTLNWINVLDKIVNAINHSPSRITRLKPIDINFKNAQTVWQTLYGDAFNSNNDLPKHKIGSHVRMANYKEVFDKGYLPNWSDEILKVDSIKQGNVNTYKVKDEEGNLFKGNFYAEDLGKTKKNEETAYRIEKIIKKRTNKDGTKQIQIKFLGYPQYYWINENDIV